MSSENNTGVTDTDNTRQDNGRFKKGAKSPNPDGRRRQSEDSRALQKRLQRWFNKNISSQQLTKMFNALTPKDQSYFAATFLPYITPKQKETSIEINGSLQVEQIIGMQFADNPITPIQQTQLPAITEEIKKPVEKLKRTTRAHTVTEETEAIVTDGNNDKPAIKPEIIERSFNLKGEIIDQQERDGQRSARMDEYNRMNENF